MVQLLHHEKNQEFDQNLWCNNNTIAGCGDILKSANALRGMMKRFTAIDVLKEMTVIVVLCTAGGLRTKGIQNQDNKGMVY